MIVYGNRNVIASTFLRNKFITFGLLCFSIFLNTVGFFSIIYFHICTCVCVCVCVCMCVSFHTYLCITICSYLFIDQQIGIYVLTEYIVICLSTDSVFFFLPSSPSPRSLSLSLSLSLFLTLSLLSMLISVNVYIYVNTHSIPFRPPP